MTMIKENLSVSQPYARRLFKRKISLYLTLITNYSNLRITLTFWEVTNERDKGSTKMHDLKTYHSRHSHKAIVPGISKRDNVSSREHFNLEDGTEIEAMASFSWVTIR